MDWISGPWEEDQTAVILWFSWPAGAGKSAIARKIAELSEEILLLASFFSRSDPARSGVTSLIATIPYQIAINFPEARRKMTSAIDRDPLVLTRSLESQPTVLVVEPLRELINMGYFDTTSLDVLLSSTVSTNATLWLSNAKCSM